jgi:hypothetical protein
MAIEDVLTTKLMAVTEHNLRFEGLLPIARALREQIAWPKVRAATAASPFARAFFVMLEGLEIIAADDAVPQPGPRVRVVTSSGSTATTEG